MIYGIVKKRHRLLIPTNISLQFSVPSTTAFVVYQIFMVFSSSSLSLHVPFLPRWYMETNRGQCDGLLLFTKLSIRSLLFPVFLFLKHSINPNTTRFISKNCTIFRAHHFSSVRSVAPRCKEPDLERHQSSIDFVLGDRERRGSWLTF